MNAGLELIGSQGCWLLFLLLSQNISTKKEKGFILACGSRDQSMMAGG